MSLRIGLFSGTSDCNPGTAPQHRDKQMACTGEAPLILKVLSYRRRPLLYVLDKEAALPFRSSRCNQSRASRI